MSQPSLMNQCLSTHRVRGWRPAAETPLDKLPPGLSREEQLSCPAVSSRAPQLGTLATLHRNTYHVLGLRIPTFTFGAHPAARLLLLSLLSHAAEYLRFAVKICGRTRNG